MAKVSQSKSDQALKAEGHALGLIEYLESLPETPERNLQLRSAYAALNYCFKQWKIQVESEMQQASSMIDVLDLPEFMGSELRSRTIDPWA